MAQAREKELDERGDYWSILEPYLTQRKDQLLSVSSFECEATPNHHNFTSKDGEIWGLKISKRPQQYSLHECYISVKMC